MDVSQVGAGVDNALLASYSMKDLFFKNKLGEPDISILPQRRILSSFWKKIFRNILFRELNATL